jgi:hypothetical protein
MILQQRAPEGAVSKLGTIRDHMAYGFPKAEAEST